MLLDAERKLQPEKETKQKRLIQIEFKPDNTEVFCMVCMEAYSNSKPEEQCMDSGNWSHFECTGISANEKHLGLFVTTVCQIKQRH